MKKRSLFFILIYLFHATYALGQKSNSGLSFYGITGLMGHQRSTVINIPGFGFDWKPTKLTTPYFGFGIKFEKLKFALEYSKKLKFELESLNIDVKYFSEYREYNHIDLIYNRSVFKFMDLRFGLGYFSYWKTNFAHSLFIHSPKLHGITVTGNIDCGDIEVQLRHDMFPIPIHLFDPFAPEFSSIAFKHNIQFFNKKREKEDALKAIQGYLLLGFRSFPVINKQPSRTSPKQFNWIGFSPQFGVEFLVPKYHFSLNFEKDIWIRPTAGDFDNILLAYQNTTLFGLRYHWQRENKKTLKFGISRALIKDLETLNTETDPDLYLYNIKGIAASFSAPLYRNLDIELRQIFSLKGEQVINPMRFSTAIIYRLRSFDY